MNNKTLSTLLTVMLLLTGTALAVEDGLGTNHVLNLRVQQDARVDGGDITIGAGGTAKQGTMVIHDGNAGNDNNVTIQGPASIGTSFTLTLPDTDGDADQVLTTDGSGALSWTAPSANAASKQLDNLTGVAINADLDPGADNTIDLGNGAARYKDAYVAGTAYIGTADIDGGSVDGAAIGVNSAITELQVDNINVNGNAITSTDSNGDITLTPDGSGEVIMTNVNIDAGSIDGIAIGANTAASELQVDNINVNGNAIISSDVNGDISLTPNGSGEVNISNADIDAGAIDGTAVGANSASSGAFTTLDASGATALDGDVDLGDASGDSISFNGVAGTDLNMNNNNITSLATPSATDDAANKGYVDNVAAGLKWKDSVKAATTAAGTLASDFANGSSVDGVTLATGDRILIKDQATGSENGIYIVQASGAPSRATDFDANAEVPAAAVFIEEGTQNKSTGWVCSNEDTVNIGVTAIAFVQFSGSGTYTAGDGLDLAGTQFSVDVTDLNGTGLTTSGNDLAVDDTAVAMLTGVQTINGVKTFGSFPVTPSSAPSTDYQAANKKYVDDSITDIVATGSTASAILRWDGSQWVEETDTTVDDSGNISAGGTLDVDGATTMDQVTVDTTDGNLQVTGSGTVDINTAADINDTLTLSAGAGNALVISAGGAADLNGNLDVADNSILGSDSSDTITFNAKAANDLDMDNNTVTGLGTPASDSDAATKSYVDNAIAGLKWKDSVKAATTAAGTLATDFANGDTIDGVTLATGDRILIKNQADATENGIYEVQASGAPSRTTDFDAGSEIAASAVFVEQGTLYGDTGWVCSNNGTPTIGVNDLTFVQFSAAGVYTAGDGLDLSGTQFSVDVTDLNGTGLTTSGNDLAVDDTAVAMLTGVQTINGVKTFGSFPVTPSSAPSADYEVANKKYVDDSITDIVATGSTASAILRWDGSQWVEEVDFTVNAAGNTSVGGTLGVDGITTLNDATGSSSKDTGALIVEGGVGIEENIYAGGILDVTGAATVNDTTGSSSKDTGALIVEGGVGIEQNANIGGTLGVTGNSTLTGDLAVNGNTTVGNASSDSMTVEAAATLKSKIIYEPDGSTISVAAGTGLTAAHTARTYIRILGSGGIDVTADPQIAAGTLGQIIILQGTSDTDWVKFDDGTGMQLEGGVSFTMKEGDLLQLIYDGTYWREMFRQDAAL